MSNWISGNVVREWVGEPAGGSEPCIPSFRYGASMRVVLGCIVAVFLVAVASAQAQDEQQVAAAEAAAKSWLALTDSGDYSGSWDRAAGIFQTSIPKQNWMNALQNARVPLGALISRKIKSARYAQSLPGAPDGEYVVIQFTSQFANRASAIETVTPRLEKDRTWKVSGYFIK
jgi:hypothetical protein